MISPMQTNNNSSYRLANAALDNDLDGMQRALEQGAYVNQPGHDRRAPLHEILKIAEGDAFRDASKRADIMPGLKLLLEAGADVDARDSFGKTPMDYALKTGNEGIINYMLAARGDLHRVKLDELKALATHPEVRDCYNHLLSMAEGREPLPVAEQVGLDMDKRHAAIEALSRPRDTADAGGKSTSHRSDPTVSFWD